MADLRISAAALSRDLANQDRLRTSSLEARISSLETELQDARSLLARLVDVMTQFGLIAPE